MLILMRKFALLFLFFVAFTTLCLATPSTPGGSNGMSPGCWPPPCSVPLDGGVTLLLAAGAAFGAKKIADARKK